MSAGLLDEIFIALGFKVNNKDLDETEEKVKKVTWNVKKMALRFIGAVVAIDRMANAMAKVNQQFINFNKQTGLSLQQANKLAGAAMLTNYTMTPEETMQSIQALEGQLAQIRLGQGNVAPFQILGISPVGKNAFDVIEDLRRAIKGIDDMTATNLIQQMGLSPEFITLLRLSKQEMQELAQRAAEFQLSPEEREKMQGYALELKRVHVELAFLKDKALLALWPIFNQFVKGLTTMLSVVVKFRWALLAIGSAVIGVGGKFVPFLGLIKGAIASVALLAGKFLLLYLILEDIAYFLSGKNSLLGLWYNAVNKDFKGEKKTDEAFEQLYGHKRGGLQKFVDWLSAGGIIGTLTGGATQKQKEYENLLRLKQTGDARGSLKVDNTVNQNNYMSFSGFNPDKVAKTTANSMYMAMLEINPVV